MRADKLVLEEVDRILVEARFKVQKLLDGFVALRDEKPDSTIDELVTEVLSHSETGLSAKQISELVGAPMSSVRASLYSNAKFERIEKSARRVRWKISSRQGEYVHDLNGELVPG